MHKTVFFYAEINEYPELGYVCNYAVEHHPFLNIVDCVDIFVKFQYLHFRSRVSTRFLKFCHYVIESGEPDTIGNILR